MIMSLVMTEDDFDSLRWGAPIEGVEKVSNTYVDSGRWVEYWTMVWREDDKFFAYDYEVPATEMQEGSEEEFDARNIYEVEPVEVTVVEYHRKK
jgi:hypothetical protein